MTRRLVSIAMTGLLGAGALLALGSSLKGGDGGYPSALWTAIISTCGPISGDRQEVILHPGLLAHLEINMPAKVHYEPGDETKFLIRGEQGLLNQLRVERGTLSLNCNPGWPVTPLEINVSGPPIPGWTLNGSTELTMVNVQQSRLKLDIQGSGNATVTGEVDNVDLNLSGTGKVSLKQLSTKAVVIHVRGNGDVQARAEDSADVSIYGSGRVELFGSPVLRSSDIRGNGRIIQMR